MMPAFVFILYLLKIPEDQPPHERRKQTLKGLRLLPKATNKKCWEAQPTVVECEECPTASPLHTGCSQNRKCKT
eukprot:134441-Amphidinium_carterae.1